jgi:hypothetical protein
VTRKKARPVQADPVAVDPAGEGVFVPLRFPLRIGRRLIRKLRLLPPTLGTLENLRALPAVGASDVLAACSGMDPTEIRAMRWTDVETAVVAAFGLLPPDLASLLRGDTPEPDTTPAPEEEPMRNEVQAAMESEGPIDLSEFTVDPREFVTHG